jgi:hypothetical protein
MNPDLSQSPAAKAGEFTCNRRLAIAELLEALESLTTRLNRGEPIPIALLGHAVDRLSALVENRAEFVEWLGRAEQVIARVLIEAMECALAALERGEAGAAGAFVMSARACIQFFRQDAWLQ